MENKHILLFYKYVEIENPKEFAEKHLEECEKLGLMGRILVAHEGINGSVSGDKKQTEEYKKLLTRDKRFTDIMFKEDLGLMHPFKKMQVKVKDKIVSFGENVDLSKTGRKLTPKEFLELYDENGNLKDKDMIILDGRNGYEARVGRFKNAICPDIEKFADFDKVAKSLEDKKDKKIVMYCTGGIRCEKASAYLKEQGFKNVSQLHGGILTFGKEYPDTVWEGKCFVFDKRMLSKINSGEDEKMFCDICNVECDLYRNCKRTECNKFCIICVNCEKKYGKCCSPDCFNKLQEVNMIKAV